MLNCAIMQPSYIPWRGYFHIIRKCEVFVFYDDVQYTRRSWRNRNRIKGPRDVRWLTVPVHAKGHQQRRQSIRETRINWASAWNVSHREKLHQAYRTAPHYARYAALLDRLYSTRAELLADFTIDATRRLAAELGIADRRFVRSSELAVEGTGTERVIALMRAVGAQRLINGPTARAYTDHAALEAAGLSVEYMSYDYPDYPQLHEPFEPQVSLIDLLCMVGPRAPEYIWGSA